MKTETDHLRDRVMTDVELNKKILWIGLLVVSCLALGAWLGPENIKLIALMMAPLAILGGLSHASKRFAAARWLLNALAAVMFCVLGYYFVLGWIVEPAYFLIDLIRWIYG